MSHRARRALVVWTCLLSASAAAGSATELRGRVGLFEGSSPQPRELSHTVVYFVPDSPADPRPPEQPVEVVTVRKEFNPRVVAVPVGTTVTFPNQDPILHNVFSVSGRNGFDLGLYRKGQGKSATFEHPGVVRVFCNVHHSMVAYVLVLETPFHTRPSDDGSFRLADLPAGAGTLTVWHERSDPWQRRIELPLAEAVEARLEIDKPRVPQHMNKFGRPYSRSSRGRRYP